jgi:HAE1 family hydrophobic/amphiphilic exporter-1
MNNDFPQKPNSRPSDQNDQEKEKQSSDSIYLSQLEFDPAKANKFLNFLLTNVRVIFLFIMAILAWGMVSFNLLPLESTPEVKIPYAIVSVSLPGASPGDVEELVVKKIENKIANLSGVKTITATALNSFATVSVEFRADEDLKEAIRKLRDAVSNLKSDLPADASDPLVSEISFSNSPVWTIVMTGPYDSFALRKYADTLEEELLKLPGTSDVQINGGDQTEIRVTYDPRKLDFYGLSMDQINGLIKANNITLPLGTLDVGKFEYSLRLDGKFNDVNELRNLPISTLGGSVLRLSDVATVVERAAERNSTTHFSIAGGTPQNAISISVIKKTGFSIIELIDSGKARIDALQKDTFPQDLSIETTYDMSKIIRKDFNNLSHEALNTIILVTLILFLFVGLKEAFTAGLVIPLVFASTFGLMLLAGQTLNFLSLFSLILSLGLLVDDAIVVVQATKQYMATGKFTPEEAVLLVFKDFFAIILTTSLTTIFAFLPLVLATGIIGQFIRSIPITTSLTLVASTIIAITINHPMAAILERFRLTRNSFYAVILVLIGLFIATVGSALTGSILSVIVSALLLFSIISLLLWYRASLKKSLLENEQTVLRELALPDVIKQKLQHHYSKETQKNWWIKATSGLVKLEKVMPSYERLLNWFLNSKFRSYFLIIIILLVFLASVFLPASGILKSEFLSPSDQELMYVNIEGPPGLVVEETQKIADQVEKILLAEKQIKNFSVTVGSSGVSSGGGGMMKAGTGGSNGNRAQFAINLLPPEERPVKQKSYVYAQELRKKLSAIQGATITLQEISGGPPSGSDFEVRFSGEDLVELERLANQYKVFLSEIPGTVNVKTSISLSPGEFTFKLKPEEMQLRGITPAQIAGTLRTAISGGDIAKVIEGQDEIQIRAEYAENFISSLDTLKALPLLNARGQKFQLSEVADVSVGSSLTSISRINQKRVVVLSASVVKPVLPGEVLTKFQKILADKPLPPGYTAIFGGQSDTNTESIYSILRAMIVAFILIIGTLVIQFNSFLKALLVLLTIPLAMTGVFFGLTLSGLTLSFPTLIGILALFGIVVKNAIILIDKINLNLRVGIPFQESITDASKSRLEAIFLTTTATIIGMLPITFYDETWQGLGAALVFGLSTSTVLTLLLVPVVFNLLFARSAARAERLKAIQKEAEQNQR